jgi:hypothetical protein
MVILQAPIWTKKKIDPQRDVIDHETLLSTYWPITISHICHHLLYHWIFIDGLVPGVCLISNILFVPHSFCSLFVC